MKSLKMNTNYKAPWREARRILYGREGGIDIALIPVPPSFEQHFPSGLDDGYALITEPGKITVVGPDDMRHIYGCLESDHESAVAAERLLHALSPTIVADADGDNVLKYLKVSRPEECGFLSHQAHFLKHPGMVEVFDHTTFALWMDRVFE